MVPGPSDWIVVPTGIPGPQIVSPTAKGRGPAAESATFVPLASTGWERVRAPMPAAPMPAPITVVPGGMPAPEIDCPAIHSPALFFSSTDVDPEVRVPVPLAASTEVMVGEP